MSKLRRTRPAHLTRSGGCPSALSLYIKASLELHTLTNRAATGVRPSPRASGGEPHARLRSPTHRIPSPLPEAKQSTRRIPPQPWPSPRAPATRCSPASCTRSPPPPPRPLSRRPLAPVAEGLSRRLTCQRRGRRCGRTRPANRRAKSRCIRRRSTRRARPAASPAAVSHTWPLRRWISLNVICRCASLIKWLSSMCQYFLCLLWFLIIPYLLLRL